MSRDGGVVLPAALVPQAQEADDERISAALLHWQIGIEAFSAGLPVDWGYVCSRMAEALLEADALACGAGAEGGAEPERKRRAR